MYTEIASRAAQAGRNRNDDSAAAGVTLALVIAVNLFILFAFKYYNFIASVLYRAVRHFSGQKITLPVLKWALPVGISFYTFQAIGYSIDVWRGKVKAERNIISYSLFVTFFPQLVAGPIERTENLLPQLKRIPKFDYTRAVTGMRLCAWGMVKKVVISDYLIAPYVEKVYSNVKDASKTMLFMATVMFAVQILCDFAGYTDIARGAARVLGYDLMKNFDKPYLSHSVTEFWRRWHISLSSWLRDYVYIPLGGSRKGKARTYINLMITFFVSGLWHGASLHFVVWGVLHGAVMCIERMTGIAGLKPPSLQSKLAGATQGSDAEEGKGAEGNGDGNRVIRALWVCITFITVCLLWVFFRAVSVKRSFFIIGRIMHIRLELFHACLGLLAVGILCYAEASGPRVPPLGGVSRGGPRVPPLGGVSRGHSLHLCFESLPKAARWAAYWAVTALVVYVMILNLGMQTKEFIYFQF